MDKDIANNSEHMGDKLKLNNAHDYLDRVIKELHAMRNEKKHPLVSVLQYLSDHIRMTRQELGALRTAKPGTAALATTADELEEIVAETARAANQIMSAAEAIEAVCSELGDDVAQRMVSAVTQIYEASAFQDITGQRIRKIVGALQHIETRLDSLMEACEPPGFEHTPEEDEHAALLNGPQLSKHANSQTDIDKLFDSL